ncbi:hypothetical protein VaNZ11_002979 [Volvox africanus]|uniref:2Fe-2S ferredoxin-type domain-containing protein n=1 Tax=Volvox africanus TaxID=51714 RepID=A0ABQ5RTF8_9CHLO|nr:hypothetical protein VaNZ11_002979 [Volvox africanus]
MHSALSTSPTPAKLQHYAVQRTARRVLQGQQQQQPLLQQQRQPLTIATPCCGTETAIVASVTDSHTSSTSAAAAVAKATDTVTVHFRQEGTSTEAKPGEDFLEVASRCRADIPTGCLHGSCGVCEVELFKYGPDGREAGSPVVMRACVAKVPRGWAWVEVGMMSADTVWGQDGWDT